jgi:hypothetical protein
MVYFNIFVFSSMQRYHHTYTSESLLEQFIREHHLSEASRVSICVSFEGVDASKMGEIC